MRDPETEHRRSIAMCSPTNHHDLVKSFWRKLSQTDTEVNQQALYWHSDWSIRRIPGAFGKFGVRRVGVEMLCR
jgi:hypothetical protein